MIKGDMRTEREIVKYTIILNKPIPKVEDNNKRYLIDGKPFLTVRVIEMLKKAGHLIEEVYRPIMKLPIVYHGIPIKCKDGGLMVYPLNKLNFHKLKQKLIEENLFFHSCYLPIKTRDKDGN